MKTVFEKIIKKLEEISAKKTCNKEKCDTKELCRICVVDDAIEIVKQEAEKYEECYKDCRDCEAYNKEKYHCPKFCKVIKETVKEIEENHNGWIPVEEELPRDFDNRFYMCIVENHEEDLPMFCQYDEEYGFGFWHDIYDEHT